MAKNKTKKSDLPKLPKGTVLQDKCFVVDDRGVAWWINPELNVLRKVE